MSTAIETANTSSSPKGMFLTLPFRSCIVHRLSRALGTRYIAISDLRDAGSNKMAKAHTKLEIITFHRSIFCLVFFVKHIMNLNADTKTARNREDLIIFLTRLLKVLIGLHSIINKACLLGEERFAFK